MNIKNLFDCLTMDEKKEILDLIVNEKKYDASKMYVKEWVIKFEPSLRLLNILLGYCEWRDTTLVCDITREKFGLLRNGGAKAWDEFVKLRGY